MRWLALGEATFVVGLWSMSPILVKLALEDLGPLQIAGARYFLGFLTLLPWLWIRARRSWAARPRSVWPRLAVMGVLAYPIGNGLLFWGMKTLPATSSAFLLNAIPLGTMALGAVWLKERPTWGQAGGIAMVLVGAGLFFGGGIEGGERLALAGSMMGVLALTVFGLMARKIARDGEVDTVSLSALPMAIGGGLLLIAAPPLPVPAGLTLAILVFLGIVNSALAYILWNHALRQLQAFEISVLGNLIPIGTALLAPGILAERLGTRSWIGIAAALVGVILVAWAGRRRSQPVPIVVARLSESGPLS